MRRAPSRVARVCRTPDARRSRAPTRVTKPSTPKITTNGLSRPSRKKRPRPPRPSHGKRIFGSFEDLTTSLHELIHLNQRHQDRERDETHHPAEDHDDERLED